MGEPNPNDLTTTVEEAPVLDEKGDVPAGEDGFGNPD
jgi:hypothetical protein